MINLTPIAKPIQKRMFEKMSVLGREKPYANETTANGELKLSDIATRTTFIRMISGQENPVVMMGGELLDKKMMAGFDDIYGPRVRKDIEYIESVNAAYNIGNIPKKDADKMKQGPGAKYLDKNIFKRPMPGIKSIDVQFKGGVRALRTANISWTCWSFTDLDRLMSHFLGHGKTVALEWGWVYNKKQFKYLHTLIDSSGKVNEQGFRDYRSTIFDEKGDFDFMVGVIKNFEYTSRDDGGFDCKTDIVSTGVNVLDGVLNQKPKTIETLNVSDADNSKTIEEKLKKVIKDGTLHQDILNVDSNLNLRGIISDLHNIVTDLTIEDKGKYGPNWVNSGKTFHVPYDYGSWIGHKNAWIIETPKASFGVTGVPFEPGKVFVKWGWFEDNVLSKFLSLVSDSSDENKSLFKNTQIKTEFRSIEPILDNDGKPSIHKTYGQLYESVSIRNHPGLETVNLKKYILPGKFFPLDVNVTGKFKKEGPFWQPDTWFDAKLDLKDNDKWIKLNSVVKDTNIFEPFTNPNDESLGYLRNMLVNVETIQSAFGVDPSVVEESGIQDFNLNIKTALENLFNELNTDLQFWDLTLTTDEVESSRVKIIDNSITYFKFEIRNPNEQKSKYDGKEVYTLIDNAKNTGVLGNFYFPVWASNSIVKRQNLTAKLPSSMQLAAMYGGNIDVIENLSGTDETFENEGTATGLVSHDGNDDIYNKHIDFAWKNWDNFGSPTLWTEKEIDDMKKEGVKIQPLTLKYGPKLQPVKGLKTKLKSLVKRLTEPEKTDLGDEDIFKEDSDFEGLDKEKLKDKPLFIPNFLTNEELQIFIDNHATNSLKQKLQKGKFTSEGRMKTLFIDSVDYLTRHHGVGPQDKSILIPLELELTIDGIGGIYPGNAFHSDYVPNRYQKEALFQCFDVNHTVDSSGWSVSLRGKMRATITGLLGDLKSFDETLQELIDAYKGMRKYTPLDPKVTAGATQEEFIQETVIPEDDVKKVIQTGRKTRTGPGHTSVS